MTQEDKYCTLFTIWWLKQNNLLAKVNNYLLATHGYDLHSTLDTWKHLCDINTAMSWTCTKEGRRFWLEKYTKCCEDFNKVFLPYYYSRFKKTFPYKYMKMYGSSFYNWGRST